MVHYDHPNDKQSIKSHPETSCGQAPRIALMFLFMLAPVVLYPVDGFGITMIATCQHPVRMSETMIVAFWFVAISFSTDGGRIATGLQYVQ